VTNHPLPASTGCGKTLERCHSGCTWARGPRMEMEVIAVVNPAKAGVHLGKMDSRFRGNDATFDGEAKNLGS